MDNITDMQYQYLPSADGANQRKYLQHSGRLVWSCSYFLLLDKLHVGWKQHGNVPGWMPQRHVDSSSQLLDCSLPNIVQPYWRVLLAVDHQLGYPHLQYRVLWWRKFNVSGQ